MNPGKIVDPPKHGRPLAVPLQARLRSRSRRARRSTGASGAASTRRWRCATTTATAASSTPARCARRYRVTRDEAHLTRGRANTLRLALSGQLGAEARRSGQGGARPVRVVQGLQARMPDRRRHGADEDRVPGALQGEARLLAARPRHRATCRATRPGQAALAPLANAVALRAGQIDRSASLAAASCRRGAATTSTDRARRGARQRTRSGAVRRHLQPLVRARERARRGPGARGSGLRGARGAAARRGTAALLRPHLSRRRHGRRGADARRAARSMRCARIVERGTPVSASSRRACSRCATSTRCCFKDEPADTLSANACLLEEFLAPRAGQAAVQGARSRKSCCTAIATRRRSTRCRRWRRCSGMVPGLEAVDGRDELLRHGRELRLRGRALRRLDEDGRADAAAGGAGGAPRRWSSRTARAAATRSPTAAGREALHVARVLDSVLERD